MELAGIHPPCGISRRRADQHARRTLHPTCRRRDRSISSLRSSVVPPGGPTSRLTSVNRKSAGGMVNPNHHEQPGFRRDPYDRVITHAPSYLGRLTPLGIPQSLVDFVPTDASLWVVIDQVPEIGRLPDDGAVVHPSTSIYELRRSGNASRIYMVDRSFRNANQIEVTAGLRPATAESKDLALQRLKQAVGALSSNWRRSAEVLSRGLRRTSCWFLDTGTEDHQRVRPGTQYRASPSRSGDSGNMNRTAST